jgi:CubicO group peptidase (beta-lactamase class C family)
MGRGATPVKLGPGTPEEAGMSASRVRHIVDLAKGWVAQGITPALVVLAARRGVIVLHEAFGHPTPEGDAPPLPRDAIYPLMSVTKPITATAAMILVEDGLLGLNRPVQWYIPEFVGEGKSSVMVHHLLTHTSGLSDEDLKAYDLDPLAERKKSVQIPPPDETEHPRVHEYLWLRHDMPLPQPPGVEMSYSGYGYELLGEIVRRVSGMSLDGFCRKRIFEPLGMLDTHYVVPELARHRVVKRPDDAAYAEWLNAPETQETPSAAGGAFSTAVDMATFGQMFLNHGTYGDARILSPASVAAMTRDQIPGLGARYGGEFFPGASWGFGWSVRGNKKSLAYGEPLQSPKALCHTGAGGVLLWVDPVYEIVGVYFSVLSDSGIPPGVATPEGSPYVRSCMDLFINAVTAAVVEP